MTVSSALSDRAALWGDLLGDYGYGPGVPSRPPLSTNELVVVAKRPGYEPVEPVLVEIRETWQDGPDPQELGLVQHGCHLRISSWHAQIANGETGAERLDVDRRKPSHLIIHRHPLGAVNGVREPAAPLIHPDKWVEHIEHLIADFYLF